MPRRRYTVKQIITRLGGPTEVAKSMGITPAGVQNWMSQNYVPIRNHDTLISMGIKKDLKLTPNDLDPHGFRHGV